MAATLWLGIVLAVLASMVGTVGKQLFRYSELQRLKGTKASLVLARTSMATGLALNVAVGPLLDMASYAFAPQGIIAPLSGLDVVWNTVTAPCTLGESLTPTLVTGCSLIALGATATSLFGQHDEKEYTPDLLKEVFLRWDVLGYLVALVLWLLFNICFLMQRSAAPRGQPFKTGDKIRGLSLGMTAGSIAGNLFCVKAFVEVVQSSIAHGTGEYWTDWLPYCLFIAAVFFAVSNIYFLTTAMREYEALFMGAVFEGSIITAACISGTIVFDELKGQEWWQITLYWLALLAIVGGIGTVCKGCVMQADAKIVVDEESQQNTQAGDMMASQTMMASQNTSEGLGTAEMARASSKSSKDSKGREARQLGLTVKVRGGESDMSREVSISRASPSSASVAKRPSGWSIGPQPSLNRIDSPFRGGDLHLAGTLSSTLTSNLSSKFSPKNTSNDLS